MPTVTVRNVSRELYRRLKEQARRNRRSMSQEAGFVLERALGISSGDAEPWHRVERVREMVRERYGSFDDAVDLVREDRSR